MIMAGTQAVNQRPAFVFLSGLVFWTLVTSSSAVDTTTIRGVNGTSTDRQNGHRDMKAVREATARLRSHIRNLPVSKEKIIPLTARNDSEPLVTLHVMILVASIMDVNDIRQTIHSALYLELRWHDQALEWDKSQHEGVHEVQIAADFIWTPQLFIANSMQLTEPMKEAQYMCVTSDGWVEARIPLMLETTCAMDMTRYPFDEQTCTIQIVSLFGIVDWELNEELYLDSFTSILALNTEWDLMNVRGQFFGQSPFAAYPEVVLTLRRKTTFYKVCLVLPMVVTSYLNTLVFLVPVQSGEKISFLVTVLVSASVYVSFFSNVMPRGLNSIPNSLWLLIGVILESVVVLLATLFILRRYKAHQTAHGQSNDELHDAAHRPEITTTVTPKDNLIPDTLSSGEKIVGTKPARSCSCDPSYVKVAVSDGHKAFEKVSRSTSRVETVFPFRAQKVVPHPESVRASRGKEAVSGSSFRMTVHHLDLIFFLVAFVANSAFLVGLYAH